MHAQHAIHDIVYLLRDVLHAPAQWQALAPFADTDADLAQQVPEEAAKFVSNEIAPLQRVGDEIGCSFHAGEVSTRPGFKAAYQAFWQAGWPSLSCAVEDGGQGLPAVLEGVLYELLAGANHRWTMAPGLLHGAYACLKHHGGDALKAQYLEKIASGEWLATMCLTEAHAGSDLGLLRTRGVPQADGSVRVNGSKIFISGGEHDLSDNIVDLVLGRLPDGTKEPKGLSLFLVPKVLPDGQRNAVVCERIEEKMGLHGSPTCVMRFDDATGWPVGEPNKGLAAMFVMMNAARLHVGLQGLGLLDAAWHKASAYAQERRQMRAPKPPGTTPSVGPNPIAEHPAIRRMLDTQRAWIDGGRVLAYHTALQLDVAQHHPGATQRAAAQRWCALVTPVLADGGAGLSALLSDLPDQSACARRDALIELTAALAQATQTDPELPYWVADDYLRAVALVLLDWAWAQIRDTTQDLRWAAPAQAFQTWVLPEFDMRLAIIRQRLASMRKPGTKRHLAQITLTQAAID